MNDDEFGQDLASRLRRGGPHPAEDLVGGALRRARVLRRRRTVTGVVAAVVAAAVVAGGAAGLGLFPNRTPSVLATPSTENEPTAAPSGGTVTSAVPPTRSPGSRSASPPTSAHSTTPSTSSPAAPGLCTAIGTSVQVNPLSGAAGTVEYAIVVTNTGRSTCVLQGFPGVSIVAGDAGTQVGAPAVRQEVAAERMLLQPGQHASASLFLTQAANHGDQCQLTRGRGFRIYLPEERNADFVPIEVNGCANPTIELMRVRPFR